MRRRFVTLDVFTEKRFAGNPLAVVLEPDGLDTAAMQSDRARVQSVRDGIRAAAGRTGAPREAAHLHAGVRIAVRGTSDGRHGRIARTDRRRRRSRASSCSKLGIGPVRCQVTPTGAGRVAARCSTCRGCRRTSARRPDERRSRRRSALSAGDIGFDGLRRRAGPRAAPYTLRAGARPRCDRALPHRIRLSGDRLRLRCSRGGVHVLPRDRARRAMISTRACSRRIGRAGGPGDRLGGGGVRRLSRRARQLQGRRASGAYRAGLRDGRPSLIELTLKIGGGKLTGASIGGGAVIVTRRHDRGLTARGAPATTRAMDIPIIPLDGSICASSRRRGRSRSSAAPRSMRISRSCAPRSPQMWNGRVLLLRRGEIARRRAAAAPILETDFASFIAWRDWGFPDTSVRNCFPMAALRSADGAFLLGVMGAHTANAGQIYFRPARPTRTTSLATRSISNAA